MLTGELRGQIDRIWDAFWSGGISNPPEVIEQITYLLFLKRLDDLHTLAENKARATNKPIERPIFPSGKAGDTLRWSRFKNLEASAMFEAVSGPVFTFLRQLGGEDSAYAANTEKARFTIPTAGLPAKVVDMIDKVQREDRDTKGDLYEYMLGKIATAGQNGQFRTPRHVIRLMVELTAPPPTDVICDPAAGTCGFLMAAAECLRTRHPEVMKDAKLKKHFRGRAFHGRGFDHAVPRVGGTNSLRYGGEHPARQPDLPPVTPSSDTVRRRASA